MYKKCYAKKIRGSQNQFEIDLWTDTGHEKLEWTNYAYRECHEADATHIGLNGHPLIKTQRWKRGDEKVHFNDMKPYQKFLIEKYGTNN